MFIFLAKESERWRVKTVSAIFAMFSPESFREGWRGRDGRGEKEEWRGRRRDGGMSERERGGMEKGNGKRIERGRKKQWGREREWERGRGRKGDRMEKGERKKENKESEPIILWEQLEKFVCLLIDWLMDWFLKFVFCLKEISQKVGIPFQYIKAQASIVRKNTVLSAFRTIWI